MTRRKIEYWVIPPEADAEFAASMEEVLDVYARPYDARHPVLCMDEQPIQLLKEVRKPIAATKKHPRRVDYEYERAGTASIFMFCEPLSARLLQRYLLSPIALSRQEKQEKPQRARGCRLFAHPAHMKVVKKLTRLSWSDGGPLPEFPGVSAQPRPRGCVVEFTDRCKSQAQAGVRCRYATGEPRWTGRRR
jgi:hypothetical protein